MADEEATKTAGDDAPGIADPPSVDTLQKALDEALAEAARNHERWVRERADLENVKRRAERDRAETAKHAVGELTRDLLPVVDNLERAVRHAEGAGGDPTLIEGVHLILKGIHEVLRRHGVSRVAAEGEPFDPAHHEAIAHIESTTHPPNSVLEEHQPGYRLHERLLRPALVTVAKAPANSSSDEGS